MTSVLRFPTRSGDYEKALTHYRAGSLRECLRELSGMHDSRSSLLSARAHLRRNEPDSALESLSFVDDSRHVFAGEREIIRVAAHTRLGNSDRVADSFARARAFTIGVGSDAMEAELEYYGALFALRQQDFDSVETSSEAIVAKIAVIGDPYSVPLEHTVARACELLEVCEALRGNFRGVFTKIALARLDAAPIDAWIASNSLANLASFAESFDDQETARDIMRRYADFPWNENLWERHYMTALSLGWCAALRGEEIAAYRWFREAGVTSTSPVARLDVSVDRGTLASNLRQISVALEEIEFSIRLARTIDWAKAGSRRESLVSFAAATASIAPDEARWALERYRAVSAIGSQSFASQDLRTVVTVGIAEGRIARAEGRHQSAITHLDAAHRLADRIGFSWRAHEAAVELAELRAGEHFLAFARREALKRPRSWLGRRTAELVAA